MSSFDAHLHLEKPPDGDTSWGPAYRTAMDALGAVEAPQCHFEVSPDFTTARLSNGSASDRRHFPTIQEAITAATTRYPGTPCVIGIHAGEYSENLALTQSISLVGLAGCGNRYYSGPVILMGTTGNFLPTIDIDPPEGTWSKYTLRNLSIQNAVNVSNSSLQTLPYAIRMQGQAAAGSTANKLSMIDCMVRGQTWGLNNKWESMIEVAQGYWHVHLSNCQFRRWIYSGGANNGGIQKFFKIRGTTDDTKKPGLYVRNCYIAGPYGGAETPYTYHWDQTAHLSILYSCHEQALPAAYLKGGTGTQTSDGIESSDWASQYNIFGRDRVVD